MMLANIVRHTARAAIVSLVCFLALPPATAAQSGAKAKADRLTTSPLTDARADGPSAADYPTLQDALDANPGRPVFVPAGDYELTAKLRIRADNSGLFGPGRIVQTNSDAPFIAIDKASGVRIRDLTLTRPEDRMETGADGIVAIQCADLVIEGVRILEHHSLSAAIQLRECADSQVGNCRIENFMRVGVDDRTGDNERFGYAFRCIRGAGIVLKDCRGALVLGNRIVERRLLPTPELQREFELGAFTAKNDERPAAANRKAWREEYTNNWHQGSGIVVSGPEVSDSVRILGNSIENAGQGMDLHGDHLVVSNNTVDNCLVGVKVIHGSRNVSLIGNQFMRNDLWSIGMGPGAASHGAVAAGPESPPRQPARPANTDGGSIIANNIVSGFGYGHGHWLRGDGRSPFKFDAGPSPDNPPLTDVLVQGNIVDDGGRDDAIENGRPVVAPRYKHAVFVDAGPNGPQGLHFSGNLFHPGTAGVSNVELKP